MVTRTEIAKRCGLIGAGAAVCLYAFFGLLQGAAIGGAAGLGLANYLFGSGTLALMANELLPRIIVAASMLAGVVLSCVSFVAAGAAAGAAAGLVLGVLVRTSGEAYLAHETVPEED